MPPEASRLPLPELERSCCVRIARFARSGDISYGLVQGGGDDLSQLAIAPLRPGGSWLALKALPLLLPLKGIFSGTIYTYRWAIMLVLAYFAEGVMRAWGVRGTSQWLRRALGVSSPAWLQSQRRVHPWPRR